MRSPFNALASYVATVVWAGTAMLWADPAQACSCAMSKSCGALAKSDAVFAATVEKIEYGGSGKTTSGQEIFGGERIVTLRDVIAYRGEAPTTIRTGSGAGDCGYDFKPGTRYIVDGYRAPDGNIKTGICSMTRPIAGNEALLDYVNSFSGPPTERRIIGTIHMSSAWKTYEHERVPVVNRRVTISGPQEFTVTTGADGQFEVLNLPPGTYRVSADIRRTDWYRDEEFTWTPGDEYACAEVNFLETPDGRVSGVIVDDDDQPIGEAFIYLRPADQFAVETRHEGGLGQSADGNGRFLFADLPPGKYHIGDAPYRKTITLGLGESVDVGKIRRPR